MSNTAPAPTNTAAPKKRRGLVLIATVAIVLLLGGGGAAYWMLAGGAEEGAEAPQEEEKEEAGPGAAVALEPFVVNLADPGGTHFLRVSLSLVVADEEHALAIGENELVKTRMRSTILELLTQQSAEHLITPDGKAGLKKAIAEGAAKAVKGLHVNDVLFSEFVVQF
jgi:flagellar FliL protein